jgi:hypothetical protein
MHDKTRMKITDALHLAHREVAMEANKVSRIRVLLGEYLSRIATERASCTSDRRLRQLEIELGRFASGKP